MKRWIGGEATRSDSSVFVVSLDRHCVPKPWKASNNALNKLSGSHIWNELVLSSRYTLSNLRDFKSLQCMIVCKAVDVLLFGIAQCRE
jgi:hypothetical protein